MTTYSRTANAIYHGVSFSLASIFRPVSDAMRQRVKNDRIRRDIRLVQQLSDRHLRDIGISRDQIEQVVRYGKD